MPCGRNTGAGSRRSTARTFRDSWAAKIGVHAEFFAATPDEVLARCDPARLAEIADQIGRANADL